jgi:hypothetical protein
MVTQAGVFGYARQTSSRATQRMQHAHDGRGPQETRSWQPARETEPCTEYGVESRHQPLNLEEENACTMRIGPTMSFIKHPISAPSPPAS